MAIGSDNLHPISSSTSDVEACVRKHTNPVVRGTLSNMGFFTDRESKHSNEVVGFLAERLALHGARALPAVHVRYVAQRLAEAQ
jgi:hypothetical protein